MCVCFPFTQNLPTQNLFRIRFLSLFPPFYYLLFPGLCVPLFFYSLVNSSSLWRSSSACHHPFFWGLFFALPPCRRLGVVAPPLLLQGPDPHGRPHCRPLRSRPRGPSSTSHFDLLINNCFITWQVVTEPVSYHLIQASVFLSHSLPSFCISSPQLLHLWQLHSPLFIEPKQTDLSNLFSP